MSDYKLSEEQIAHFIRYGYLRVPECFSRDKAAEWTADIWTRLGFSPTDKSTWTTECTHMPEHKEEPVKTFAPKAWAAICALLGGEERLDEESATWNDAFIVNLGTAEMEGKWPHPAELEGWHVDGDSFVHFLDSPEQGLLVIPLFSDIEEHGGGTMVCIDSVREVAKFLYHNPQGVSPYMIPRGRQRRKLKEDFYDTVLEKCDEFHEMTGRVGDVILLHPLMMHCQSVNSLRIPRIITNPPVCLKKPFNFDRDDGLYSIVEKKTLHDLGKARLRGWKIKGGRDEVVPERVQEHEKMRQEELARLSRT
ncbi:hypothetical protein N7468_001730 [Penicillium chermesinum]|uniref:Uncharacterized protein n=1 Tax=Penicillium chermesinum TaxID=63820 RepID=A0A9W9PK32_9EURO|nr:uncharacterized protein N7468_001730 [Penicillium chermesinum]KAJ5246747.1 hypothetical protein N7468_001730 [Penicillium chermesinum]KAJ6145013.1 hypothetical protein N7470_008908 [Penicillium chermesinum]